MITTQALKSADIPFTPLEELAEIQAEAACPDDAEIDLSIWAPPQETTAQADAWSILSVVLQSSGGQVFTLVKLKSD